MALFAVFDAANICNSFLICVVLFLKNRENVQEMYFLLTDLLGKVVVLLIFIPKVDHS